VYTNITSSNSLAKVSKAVNAAVYSLPASPKNVTTTLLSAINLSS